MSAGISTPFTADEKARTSANRRRCLPWEEFQQAMHKLPEVQPPGCPFEAMVVCGAVPQPALGWSGSVVHMSTKAMFTFYPSTPTHDSTFSDKVKPQTKNTSSFL